MEAWTRTRDDEVRRALARDKTARKGPRAIRVRYTGMDSATAKKEEEDFSGTGSEDSDESESEGEPEGQRGIQKQGANRRTMLSTEEAVVPALPKSESTTANARKRRKQGDSGRDSQDSTPAVPLALSGDAEMADAGRESGNQSGKGAKPTAHTLMPAMGKRKRADGRDSVKHVQDWQSLCFDEDFNIGLILGESSSGKSTVLRHFFGDPRCPEWSEEMAVVSQFADPTSGAYDNKGAADEAQDRLSSVGLGSIPTWMRPYACLSNGEQARARLARQIADGAVIDNFTSVVNRHAAKAMASAVSRFIRRRHFKRVVFASSCGDVVPWLQPDWVLVLHGKGSRAASLHHNPNSGEPCASLQPCITMALSGGDASGGKDKNVRGACEAALSLKHMPDLDVKHSVDGSRGQRPAALTIQVRTDEATTRSSEAFDYEFDGKSTFQPPTLPDVPKDFRVGVLVGPSGSGKTTILKSNFNLPHAIEWTDGAPISTYFDSSDGRERLCAVGLDKKCWSREYAHLSSGEQFKAELARALSNSGVVDEFTSNVDRHLAKQVARDVMTYVRKKGLRRLVFATCHDDFVPWLQPDWVYSTQTQELLVLRPKDCLPSLPEASDIGLLSFDTPQIQVDLERCKGADVWHMFSEFHYMDKNINNANRFFVAWWRGTPVGCVAATGFPGSVRQGVAFREHRIVVLPDFQGLGIGTRMSNAVASSFLRAGFRYFSRTAHPRFGSHRQKSDQWVGTTSNLGFLELVGVYGSSVRIAGKYKDKREKQKFRLCYSHEYVGSEDDCSAFKTVVEEQVFDEFTQSMLKGRKRDLSGAKKSVEELKEKQRSKLLKKAAKEGQSGTTAFSKGGVTGPNKLEGLVALGSLKPGKDAMTIVYNGKTITGDFIADRLASTIGKYVFEGRSFGDILTFTNAMLAARGFEKRFKTSADCWKVVKQDGVTMQELKAKAAALANAKRVNPRSTVARPPSRP